MARVTEDRIDAAFAEEFVARYRSIVEARDVDGWVSLCTDDVVLDDAGPDALIVGREEAARLWRHVFDAVESVETTVVGTYLGTNGRTVAIHLRETTKRRGAAQVADTESVDICEFRDRKVARWTVVHRNSDWMGDLWP